MRKYILLSLSTILLNQLHSQQSYWQQKVNYNIDVSLDDKQRSLKGFEKIEYTNNSPDTLHFIWFHLWPNAYKNDQTAFSDQMLENGKTSFYFSSKDQKGYINQLNFKVNDQIAETEDHPQFIDVVKLKLPAALPPSGSIIITTPFFVKLPYNFSRGGYDGESFQITQWYPKPAVYDTKGWHPMPYFDQGEFYSEFGNFEVRITVPENYVVAATGDLQDQTEKDWLAQRKDYTWTPIKHKQKTKGGAIKVKTQAFPTSATNIKILRYRQNNVHDFAWFADKRFVVLKDTCILPSGKSIDVYSYFTNKQEKNWKRSIDFARNAIRTRSRWIGEYPYNTLSVVQGPESFGGGMEYPTITIISPIEDEKLLDYTIAHEIGHNWFYGILGSNEREYPWMDEGLNTYYDNRYSNELYKGNGEIDFAGSGIEIKNLEKILFETRSVRKLDQPINTSSEKFNYINYSLVAYYKTGAWLEFIETRLGRPALDSAIQYYFKQWQFKHPQPEDFKTALEQSTGKNLDSLFVLIEKKGSLPSAKKPALKSLFLFNPRAYTSYIRNPSQQLLIYGPSIGGNKYDKFMIGGLLTNIKLPPSAFEFLITPMYATGTSKLVGTGLARYNIYPNQIFQHIQLGVAGSSFTIDEFTPEGGETTYLSYYKIVPSIRLRLKEKNPRSTFNRFLQFKSFLINEDELRFYRDTIISPSNDTTVVDKYGTQSVNRTLNQLRFVIENYRVLYPYSGEIRLDQGKDFARLSFTGKYFFNYPKAGGLEARFFAGKFFYLGEKTLNKQFETDRYHLNMTGPNGYEDYTYSDYFIGRNEFEGLPSQQIMMRDGGFKIRTDLLADKVGKTDDWLIALNLSSSIPNSINPLSLLPIKIPLKVFADFGTNADAWVRNANTDRFLFDLGLQIPLFKETVNIYIPVLYNKVYRDYVRSTIPDNRFWKTISFTIDISNFSLRKFNRDLAN